MLFGERIMARVVVAEAAWLLGPLRPCPLAGNLLSVWPRTGASSLASPWQVGSKWCAGRWVGGGVLCPHNPLDPMLVERGTVPLGVGLGLAEFGGVLNDSPFL